MLTVGAGAAVAWLTDDRAQQEQMRRTHRSPSWQQAGELADVLRFSVLACKKALDRNGNDKNAAAAYLFDHGARLEEEVMDESSTALEASAAPLGGRQGDGAGDAGEEDDGTDEIIRTVSFKPEAASTFTLPTASARRHQTVPPSDSAEDNLQSELVEFVSAVPLTADALPHDSTARAFERAPLQV